MRFFNRQGWGRMLLLAAAFAFSAAAEDRGSHNLSIGGGNDLAWLKVNGLALGGVDDDGTLNKGYISLKYKTPFRSLVDWGVLILNTDGLKITRCFGGLTLVLALVSMLSIEVLRIKYR